MDECLELLNAPTAIAWFETLAFAAEKLGYSKVLYGLKSNKEARNEDAVIMSTFPPEWRSHYDSEGYASVDPTVSHCFTSSLPVVWNKNLYSTPAEHEFAEEAKDAGLTHGVTLPIHGPQGQIGLLSLSCQPMPEAEYGKTLSNSLGAATMLRDYSVVSGSRHLLESSPARTPHLTAREVEILHWAWAEKTSWEIGKILNLSRPTVEFHFKNIRRKLNVNSRRFAVARAIQLDLLTV